MNYKVIQGNPDSPTFKNDIFSSDTVVLSKEELRSILIDNKYFFNK